MAMTMAASLSASYCLSCVHHSFSTLAFAHAPASPALLMSSSHVAATPFISSHCPAALCNSAIACVCCTRQLPSCILPDREVYSGLGSRRQLRLTSSSSPSSSSRKVTRVAEIRFEYGRSKVMLVPDDSLHKSTGPRLNSLFICHSGGFNTPYSFPECDDEVERMSTDCGPFGGEGLRSSDFDEVSPPASKGPQEGERVRPRPRTRTRPASGISLCNCCSVLGRRPLVAAALGGFLISSGRANRVASASTFENSDYSAIREAVHPARPIWYGELYAQSLARGMASYEAEVADYKRRLFHRLDEDVSRVLELGIGTGPNLKYYGNLPRLQSIVGVDPNLQMAKYCTDAVTDAGLSTSQFTFLHAVAEGIPVQDESVDAVVCTHTLCSVADVASTLEEAKRVLKVGGVFLFVEHVAAPDGSALRFWQGLLDPLQQWVADGCHLARDTLRYIEAAQFRSVQSERFNVKSVSIVSPHIMGVAYK